MRHHVDDNDGDDDMVGNRFHLFFFSLFNLFQVLY